MRRASMNHPSAAKKPSSYSTVARAMRAKARRADALSMLAAEHEEVSAMLAHLPALRPIASGGPR